MANAPPALRRCPAAGWRRRRRTQPLRRRWRARRRLPRGPPARPGVHLDRGLTVATVASEVWSVGDAYEAYVGRWSRRVAAVFLRWLDLPAGGRWLDVGCGTGARPRGQPNSPTRSHPRAVPGQQAQDGPKWVAGAGQKCGGRPFPYRTHLPTTFPSARSSQGPATGRTRARPDRLDPVRAGYVQHIGLLPDPARLPALAFAFDTDPSLLGG